MGRNNKMKRFIITLLVCFITLPTVLNVQKHYAGTDSRSYVITADSSIQPSNDDDRTQTD